MIEIIKINGQDVPLSLGAESITLPEGRLSPFYTARTLSNVGKKYYTQAEGFMFFDEAPGVSIAAQLVEWINADIDTGQYRVYLPGDHLVYLADIQVQQAYIIVNREELLEFEEALEQIRQSPNNSQVHNSGHLARAFAQHRIDTRDLQFFLEPGRGNPYYLHKGRNLTDYALLGGCTLALLLLLNVGSGLVKQLYSARDKKTAVIQTIIIPKSQHRLHTDLDALGQLMRRYHPLLAYQLKDLRLQKEKNAYRLIATGDYHQHHSLARLQQLAEQLGGAITVQAQTWILRAGNFRPPAGREPGLVPIADTFEQYRQLANRKQMDFRIETITRNRHRTDAAISLALDYPTPATLQHLALDTRPSHFHGALNQVVLSAEANAAWKQLTLGISITGK